MEFPGNIWLLDVYRVYVTAGRHYDRQGLVALVTVEPLHVSRVYVTLQGGTARK